jgi:hypothetical protein
MAIRQSSMYCRGCGRRTLHQKEILSMAWGCLLTILTGLLFLPFWILADFCGFVKPYRCQVCGRARHGGFASFTLLVIVAALMALFISSLWSKARERTTEQVQGVNQSASNTDEVSLAESTTAKPSQSPAANSPAMPTQPAVHTEACATRPIAQHDASSASQSARLQSATEAGEALSTATRACLMRLKATDAYKDAARKVFEAETKVESLRGEATDDLMAAVKARLSAAKDLQMLEANALARDEAVGVTRKAYVSARDRDKKKAAALAAKTRDAAEEKDHIANSPINKAIRGHYLISGMTYEEAVEALGRPYSVTDAGNTVFATWEFGNGNFWSATFLDDEAVEVSHTRL